MRGVAGLGVRVPVAEQARFLLPGDVEEAHAEAQVPVLALVGVVDFGHAALRVLSVDLHRAPREGLYRPVEVLPEVGEELRVADVVAAVAVQKLTYPLGNQDSIRVALQRPVVVSEPAVLEDLVPHLDEHWRVEGGHVLAAARGVEVGVDGGGPDAGGVLAEDVLPGPVADHEVGVAAEDADAALELLEQQARLGAPGLHEGEAEHRRGCPVRGEAPPVPGGHRPVHVVTGLDQAL
mmetsp:Transcript_60812/g.171367  ORF Transcript_60812/g.171367 Transcript_60812/m.171367 type:complete len:236 (+) Transcript_60812:207-914(+)